MYAFCSCVLQFYTFCKNSAAFQAGSCVNALQYASERLPRHHFKTATYATQKLEMEEKTLCCQRLLRDAKTCFVFFRRLGRDSFPWRSNAPILYGSVTPPLGPIRPLLTMLEKTVLHFENLLCIMKVVVNRCSDRGL